MWTREGFFSKKNVSNEAFPHKSTVACTVPEVIPADCGEE
jgi:hypothetical protein